MRPRISVIIPVFNGARFIKDALTSVCNQTYLPNEVVVADDASTDNTREVVAEFARTSQVPIALFSMEKNTGGPYGPASRAFYETSGEYVCVLDADDMYDPEAFATYIAMFAADTNANVGLATTDFMSFEDGTGAVVQPSYYAKYASLIQQVINDPTQVGVLIEREAGVRMMCADFVVGFKGMIAREAWVALRGPNLAYRVVCDCEFVWRLLTRTNYRVRMLNRPLVRVRARPGSMSSDNLGMGRELVRLFRSMIEDVKDSSLQATILSRLDKELFDIAYTAYKQRSNRMLIPAVWNLGSARLRRTLGRWAHSEPAVLNSTGLASRP